MDMLSTISSTTYSRFPRKVRINLPSEVCHVRIAPSFAAENNREPSEEKSKLPLGYPVSFSRMSINAPLETCHRRTEPLRNVDAIVLPSGENATQFTES